MTQEERQETDGSRENKVSPIELIKKTAYMMLGKDHGEIGWEPFPLRLVARKHLTADPLYYALMDHNILKRLSAKSIALSVIRYWQSCPATAAFKLTPDHARMAVEFFLAFSEPFDEPINPVLFAGDYGYCYHRLPFDPNEGFTPTFDEMMSRTENALALMAWCGSIFVQSELQQYVWIYGEGMNGKSSFANFLHSLLGEAAASTHAPSRAGPDRFWASQFLGKRLVILPDCNNYMFINSGEFKSLTGGDHIRIEEKGQGAYSTVLDCKFMVLSNQKPHLEDDPASLRRAIYCKMEPIKSKRMSDRNYQALLASEAPAFIHKCIEEYKRVAPNGEHIPIDASIAEELTAATEERWELIAKAWLHLYLKETLAEKQFKDWPKTAGTYMQIIKRQEKLTDPQYRSFIAYLQKRHGVIYKGVKISDGSVRYLYVGCEPNGQTPNYARADAVRNGLTVVDDHSAVVDEKGSCRTPMQLL